MEVILNCESISPVFKGFFIYCDKTLLVSTIHQIERESRDANIGVLKSSYQALTKYTRPELVDIFDNKRDSKEYNDFCSDIPIFFAVRLHLSGYKILIPVVKHR